MPAIYFHGNCNWYKEYNSTIWYSANSQLQNTGFHQSPPLTMHFHQPWTRDCVATQKVACLPCHCSRCWNAPPTASQRLYPLFGIQKHSPSISECQWLHFCSTWRNSVIHLCLIDTSTSDAICQTAPLLPSVTQQQNGTDYWWEGSTHAAIPPTSASDVVGQHNKIEGIAFGAALMKSSYLNSRVLLPFFKKIYFLPQSTVRGNERMTVWCFTTCRVKSQQPETQREGKQHSKFFLMSKLEITLQVCPQEACRKETSLSLILLSVKVITDYVAFGQLNS